MTDEFGRLYEPDYCGQRLPQEIPKGGEMKKEEPTITCTANELWGLLFIFGFFVFILDRLVLSVFGW